RGDSGPKRSEPRVPPPRRDRLRSGRNRRGGIVHDPSRDSLIDQGMEASLVVRGAYGCVDGAIEMVVVGEGVVGQMVRALRSRQTISMSLSSGAYFGSHATLSQCSRAWRALRVSLEGELGG